MDDNDKYQKMRLARNQILDGKSPRARGDEKMRVALDWVYRWGWSSPKIIEQIGGASRSGLAARLVKRGLLRATRTESGGGLKGIPEIMLTLTELGQQEVERTTDNSDNLLDYDRDPYRIDQLKLRHDTLAQQATAKALAAGTIQNFRTERELAQRSQKGFKQPDIVWLVDGKRIGIEVELTAKWSRQFDQFVHSCLLSLSSNENKEPRFHQILLATDSPAIKRRYEEAFTPGKSYDYWMKDGNGKWKVESARKVPAWVEGRFKCKLFD